MLRTYPKWKIKAGLKSFHNREYNFYKSPMLNFHQLIQNKLRSDAENYLQNFEKLADSNYCFQKLIKSCKLIQNEKGKQVWDPQRPNFMKLAKALICLSFLTFQFESDQMIKNGLSAKLSQTQVFEHKFEQVNYDEILCY